MKGKDMRLTKVNRNAEAGGSRSRPHGRFGRAAAVLSAAALAIGISGLTATTASAATLTSVSWTVSNNQVAKTAVTYAYSFKPATTGLVKTITFAVSGAGLGGTPTISKNYGIGAGSVGISGQTITYTVTTPTTVTAGVSIYLEFAGLTNPSVAASYTTSITTKDSVAATIDGPTVSNAVTMAATNTAISATVAKSTTFTVDTTAFTLALDPSLPALADQSQAVGLSVLTNANSGYTLTVGDSTGLRGASAGNPVIPAASTGKGTSVVWPGANRFGYTVTGTGATIDTAFSGTKYAGYVTGGEQIASRPGPTGGTADTISIVNRVAIDYSSPTGDFTDTVTYTLTPNYA